MTSVHSDPNSRYPEEAGTFLSTMGEMAPHIGLDYSVDSLQRLDQYISEYFDNGKAPEANETLLLRVGSYVGEVIIRHLGGYWNEEGRPEINEVGPLDAIYPLEKAKQRFQNGKEDSLAWYYHAIAKQAYEAEQQQKNQTRTGADEGLMGLFKGLFRK